MDCKIDWNCGSNKINIDLFERGNLKIFIPSYRRPYAASTPALLDACAVDYILVLRPSQVRLYRENPRFRKNPHCRIAVLNGEEGLAQAREACRDLVDPGEWCLQLDDNIRRFTAADPDFYRETSDIGCNPLRVAYQPLLNVVVDFNQFYHQVITDSIREAEGRGANVVAFSPHENPYFRRYKFRDVAYTQNKAVLLRNTGLSWDQSNGHDAMEEYALCAAQHLEYGRVLVNYYGHPVARHYEPGGLGPYAQRLLAKLLACQDIMERFPGFFRQQKEGELTVRWRSLQQIEKWRSAYKFRLSS